MAGLQCRRTETAASSRRKEGWFARYARSPCRDQNKESSASKAEYESRREARNVTIGNGSGTRLTGP